ncbi:hypothetical protein DRE_07455 [Drechslerella stenobrocha 248]|uniref:Amine oxidase domain-containing protein n=1 Tax=Drechslerella stenobrocha 248 TaxID=1043628 RepID=W7HV23_9PEZI|nr:hypothetical protein DRE_07455 [Drechslerella stenobrocha 248]
MTIAKPEVAQNGDQPVKQRKVIIVGAGTCGLRAAEVLIQTGCDVLVLEARDRVGGRVATSSKLGLPLDLGANWIHGNQGNPIVEIAERAHSSYSAGELDDTVMYAPDGVQLPKRLGEDLMTKMWDYFEDGIEYSARNFGAIETNVSFVQYYRERVGAEQALDGEHKAYQMQIVDLLGSIVATDIERQDLKNLHLEKPIPGENLFLSSTYGPVMELMAETALANGCVRLNAPVEQVETTYTPTGPLHTVCTKGGEVYQADSVLVTVPLGSLKQDRIKFTPPMPDKMRQAIKHLGYGSLEKTYISFPTAFWGTDGPSYYAFLAPDYAPANRERKSLSAISLAHLPAPYSQPTLLFYTHGGTSKQITDMLQQGPPESSRDKVLAFFQPFFSRLPNYSADDANCVPTDCLSTNWLNDEYAGNGSYTNFPVGLVDGVDDIKTIREGVPGQRLWFCGEHTAPLLGLASVSGAYWAGEITARRCLVEFGMMSEEEERAFAMEESF